ncbi:Cytochrome P450 E-class group I protein [Dioscorea alata]|uniref:Cytochrome P450 E-class group I protein n=1 Tax=Dioscorea alata TaxID=55571 RepID=A0ACB7UZB6_DIOAL|nr:Cytochrome P450 E-class group I protein [Dioscorea alata]
MIFWKKLGFRWVLQKAKSKDITCILLRNVHAIIVNSPELACEFLKKNDSIFASRRITMATEYSSRGFLSIRVAPWGDQWKKIYYSGNIIRKIIFGCRHFGKVLKDGGPGPGPEEIEHVDAAFTVLSLAFSFCVSDFMPSLRIFDIDGHERIMKKTMKPGDIVDVFISLKDNEGKPLLTIEEIKAQVGELILATVDNPSNTVEWTMAEILNQPDILRKAIEEIDHYDFPNLPYLKACGREALRLHPIAPFNLPHVSTTDTTVAGFFIPKGSQVLLSRVGLGRNPKVWEFPMRFNLDMHLNEINVGLTEPDLRFISFSIGRRGCKEAPLGMMMTYMLLARIIRSFTWSLPIGEGLVNLSEEERSLFMAKPLHALAKPMLAFLKH